MTSVPCTRPPRSSVLIVRLNGDLTLYLFISIPYQQSWIMDLIVNLKTIFYRVCGDVTVGKNFGIS